MPSDIRRSTVGAVSSVVTKGTTPTTLGHAFQSEGVNFVKVESISADGRFLREKMVKISPEANSELSRSQLSVDDILFTIAGTIGRTAIVTPDILPANTNQAVAIVRPRKDLVIPRFLLYSLANPRFVRSALRNTVESVQANFSLGELKAAEIVLPPLSEQRSVVEVLGSLDDRIDLLRQEISTCESIAGALFKSWFIDFDPVRSKSEGREPEGMSADIAALFPSEFVDSEVGPIPKGWVCAPFGKTISVLGGGTPKTSVAEYWNGDLPWFSVVDAPADGQVFTTTTEKRVTQAGVDNSSAKIMPPWTTIISARGTVGKLAMTAVPMAMNQSCYGLRPFDGGSEPLVYLSAQRLVADLKRLAHGGVFDTITRDTLNSVMVASPPSDIESAFDSLVRPLFEKALVNRNMVDSLVETRNLLLPRLISGRISVSLCEVDV